MLLSIRQVHELEDLILGYPGITLLTVSQFKHSIPSQITQAMNSYSNLIDQLSSDLNYLNQWAYPTEIFRGDEKYPLELWLLNVKHRLSIEPISLKIEKILSIVEDERLNGTIDAPIDAYNDVTEIDEAYIHQNQSYLLNYDFLVKAEKVSSAIAQIEIKRYINGVVDHQSVTYGTGWLISPTHVITNHHVIDARTTKEGPASNKDLQLQALNAKLKFKYNKEDGNIIEKNVLGLELYSSKYDENTMDYAILAIEPFNDSETISPLTIEANFKLEELNEGGYTALNIIQHPAGFAKKLGIRNNLCNRVEDRFVYYFTDTDGGSSGAPVCLDDWGVVALHKGTKRLKRPLQYADRKAYYENFGIRIDKILEDIKMNAQTIYDAIDISS